MSLNNPDKNSDVTNDDDMINQLTKKETLNDIRYLCKSNSLITESLQKGCDVTQLANGDIIVTEVKVVNIQYSWDAERNKMVRLGNSSNKS